MFIHHQKLATDAVKIGLLGGSFNPAHAGHLHISRAALQLLNLDEVWWLVSPQNPLKPVQGMAPLAERVAGAQKVVRDQGLGVRGKKISIQNVDRLSFTDYSLHALTTAPWPLIPGNRIRVTDIEWHIGTRYTVDTIHALQKKFPRVQFVWLMGADNLAGFHRWRRWQEILAHVPICVFDRAPFAHHALRGVMATRGRERRIPFKNIRNLADSPPPAWGYVFLRRHSASSTAVRKMLGKEGAGGL